MSNSQCSLCGKEAELMKVAEEWLLKEIAKDIPNGQKPMVRVNLASLTIAACMMQYRWISPNS